MLVRLWHEIVRVNKYTDIQQDKLNSKFMELRLEKPWKSVKEKLMEHNTKLTEEDLNYEKGKEDELLESLSKKMGRSKQEIKAWIESMSFND